MDNIEVTVHMAVGERVPSTHIMVSKEQPPLGAFVSDDKFIDMYTSEGNAIEDALWKTLPGGTYDRLLLAILTRKASMLRVTF